MKFFLFVIISAVAIFSAVQGSDCPRGCEGCEYREDGESWPGQSNKCLGLTCVKSNGEVSATAVGCALFQVSPNCIIVPGEVGARYPDCCPRPRCST